MNNNYLSTIIIIEVFCIVFSVILLCRLKKGLGVEREVRILRIMFLLYMTMLCTDILWALTENGTISPPRLVGGAINAAADMAVSWGCYYWYKFIGTRLGRERRGREKMRVVMLLPVAVISALDLISIFTGWLFYMEGGLHYQETSLFAIQGVVNYFYLLWAEVASIYGVIRSKSRQERSEFLLYSFYIFVPVITLLWDNVYCDSAQMPLTVFLALLILYLTIYVDRENELLRQREQLTRSRVAIINSQIQPHFLYNALSVIVYYCDRDPQIAKETTLVFSDYLRENLNSLKSDAPVPFEQELAHVKNYLYLEKQRFEGRLNIAYDIQAVDFQIPPISVQPLVENAVRHGIVTRKSGGKVVIATREEPECWKVIVSDDGEGFTVGNPEETDQETSIDHVRRRVESMSGGTLTVESTVGSGTTAAIRIPKGENEK